VRLLHLLRLDNRLAGHLDGLAVSAEFGWGLCEAQLEAPTIGALFVATQRAIQDADSSRLERFLRLGEAVSAAEPGLVSAFGWTPAQFLRGTVKALLECSNAFRSRVGISACVMHAVDPGPSLDAALRDADTALRARALRAIGELGRLDLITAARRASDDSDEVCRFWAAWSAVVLGDRGRALEQLLTVCQLPTPRRKIALRLSLRAAELSVAHELLRFLGTQPEDVRSLIEGAGIVGDPHYIPWLIKQMADSKLARLAGESFSLITGLDLAYLDLDRRPPEGEELGPTADPNDENVAMDPDEGLPLPDADKLAIWWQANRHAFAVGTRYFMGQPVNPVHCLKVLKDGFQRQRGAAALYLSLLRPGTPLFNTRAPAWRQQRLLAGMRAS
jgi:uncharacterized protein (TIGR02270 family)